MQDSREGIPRRRLLQRAPSRAYSSCQKTPRLGWIAHGGGGFSSCGAIARSRRKSDLVFCRIIKWRAGRKTPLALFERLRVPNRDVFCRITGQALQCDLMVAFFATVLNEGAGVGSCTWLGRYASRWQNATSANCLRRRVVTSANCLRCEIAVIAVLLW